VSTAFFFQGLLWSSEFEHPAEAERELLVENVTRRKSSRPSDSAAPLFPYARLLRAHIHPHPWLCLCESRDQHILSGLVHHFAGK
jgi:hypothetical protein